jgi:uncharacterized SAM-dependent methyltransferase
MQMSRSSAIRVVSPDASNTPPQRQPATGSVAVIAEISAGLLAPDAYTSPKFLYDALGSKLFEAICELPEYYPTRTEAGIFERHGAEIARAIGTGAPDRPGRRQLRQGGQPVPAAAAGPVRPGRHLADFLQEAVERLQQRFPHIEMTRWGWTFPAASSCPTRAPRSAAVLLSRFLDRQFHARTRRWPSCAACAPQCGADGGLLIGIDLIKDSAVLDAAYDDALGVTAAFNLNVLRHVNRLLGADFDIRPVAPPRLLQRRRKPGRDAPGSARAR